MSDNKPNSATKKAAEFARRKLAHEFRDADESLRTLPISAWPEDKRTAFEAKLQEQAG